MAAKRVVTFYGALKVIARQIDPSLKTKPAKRKSKHPVSSCPLQLSVFIWPLMAVDDVEGLL